MSRSIVTLILVGIVGLTLVWVGCNSQAPTDFEKTEMVGAISSPQGEICHAIFFDDYVVTVSGLAVTGNGCSAKIKVTGNPDLNGEYTVKLQAETDAESLLRCGGEIRDERGTLFGLFYNVDRMRSNSVYFEEYTESDRLSIMIDREEAGWVTETYVMNGRTELLRYPQMTDDEIFDVASVYDDIKTGNSSESHSGMVVSPRGRILLEQFEKFEKYYDGNNSLSDNIHGFLLVDLVYSSSFHDMVKRKRLESGQAGVRDLLGDITLKKFCDAVYIGTAIKCLAGGAANPGCEIGAIASISCKITAYVFDW